MRRGETGVPGEKLSEQEREPYVVVIPLLTCYCQSFILHLIIYLFVLVVSSSAWVSLSDQSIISS